MPLNDASKLGLANRFSVKIDFAAYDLGSWAQVDGLTSSGTSPSTGPATPATPAGTSRATREYIGDQAEPGRLERTPPR